MSFGWSAGDIAMALTLAYKLIQALDSVDGAAKDYREAVCFLRDLKRTLDPLAKFANLSEYPSYGEEISLQVAHIKVPVESFLRSVMKYEPTLGAQSGHHRHIIPKWKWHMLISTKALALKKNIKSHLVVINNLMQRLTLDVVLDMKAKLPITLRNTLEEVIRPELLSVLQEHALSSKCMPCKYPTGYAAMSYDISEIKREMQHSNLTQKRIDSCFQEKAELPNRHRLLLEKATNGHNDLGGTQNLESAQEVYYLVLLYIGHFLKNLFLRLSNMVEPQRALMPMLLAKYNISFLDAIGSPPRVLPVEFFRSFKILNDFVQHEFKTNGLPGSAWVDRGRYQMFSLANNRVLNDQNWNNSIGPGTTIAMSMSVRRQLKVHSKTTHHCPGLDCKGTWLKAVSQSWITCPECQKEVLTAALIPLNDNIEVEQVESTMLQSPSGSSSGSELSRSAQDWGAFPRQARLHPQEVDEDDISLFKRIVQEVSEILNTVPSLPRTDTLSSQTMNSLEASVELLCYSLSALPLLISAAEHYQRGFELLLKWKRFRTDFISFIDTLDTNKVLFDQATERLLIDCDVPHHELSFFMTDPNYEGWSRPELSTTIQTRLGSSYPQYLNSLSGIRILILDLMDLLLVKNGKVIWATDKEDRWSYQMKRIQLSFNKKGARILASLETEIRLYQLLLRPE